VEAKKKRYTMLFPYFKFDNDMKKDINPIPVEAPKDQGDYIQQDVAFSYKSSKHSIQSLRQSLKSAKTRRQLSIVTKDGSQVHRQLAHNVRPLPSEDYDCDRPLSTKSSVFRLSAAPSLKSRLSRTNVEKLPSASKVSERVRP